MGDDRKLISKLMSRKTTVHERRSVFFLRAGCTTKISTLVPSTLHGTYNVRSNSLDDFNWTTATTTTSTTLLLHPLQLNTAQRATATRPAGLLIAKTIRTKTKKPTPVFFDTTLC